MGQTIRLLRQVLTLTCVLTGCNALVGNDPIVVLQPDASDAAQNEGDAETMPGPDAGESGKGGQGGGGAGAGGQAGAPADDPTCGAADSDGESCDDGLYCTQEDVCDNQVCTGIPVECPATTEPCRANECSEDQKGCALVPAPDGTNCGGTKECRDGTCECPTGQTKETSCLDDLDNDCDGMLDCADPDCSSQCPSPGMAPTNEGTVIGCVYIEYCNDPEDQPQTIGTVCRTYTAAGCPFDRSLEEECRSDLASNSCAVARPFILCDRFGRGSECIRLE